MPRKPTPARRLAGVLTISDACSRGERVDVSGHVLVDALRSAGWKVSDREVVPDEVERIAATLRAWAHGGCDLILTTGGTGFAPRDVTPEATRQVIERDAPGIPEMLRAAAAQKFPNAWLSRGAAGIAGKTLIVNLPGSPGGARDGIDLLLPLLPHAVALLRDEPSDHQATAPEERRHEGPVTVLQANLDDLSPELYENTIERLSALGALDVFLTPVIGKKSRPATVITALAPAHRTEALAAALFEETTTFGVRYNGTQRLTLTRRWQVVKTEYGDIRVKVGAWNDSDVSASPEYEDVKTSAARHNVPARTVYRAAERAYEELSLAPKERGKRRR